MESVTHIVRHDKFVGKRKIVTGLNWLESMQLDFVLIFLFFILMAISLMTIYSATMGNMAMVIKQAIYYGIAFLILFMVARFQIYHFRRFAIILYALGLLLLLMVLVVGPEINGARRWIDLGIVHFQPSEYVKIVTILALCWILTYKPLPISIKQICYALVITFLPALLIFIQPDLGTAVILVMVAACLIFLAGIRLSYILVTVVAFAASLPFLWYYVLHDYHQRRILSFINPERDPLGSGWSLIQSKIAIGTGGIWGKGWNNNQQAGLEFLPETHTDFIFSIFAEEYGLIGVTFLVFIYLLIILRCFYITVGARDSFEKLFCGGLAFIFSLYIVINIGMVSGIMPVVGVPLPLVSYGGTALVTTLGAFGIVMSVRSHSRKVT